MKRPIISTTIILLVVFLLGYFILLNQFNEIRLLKFNLKQKTDDFKSLEEYFNKLSLINEELAEYETEMQKIHSALPLKAGIPSVFNFIQKVSLENNLELQRLSLNISQSSKTTKPVVKDSKVKETSFSLVISGSYNDFKNFLSVLEKSSRIIELENIDFSYTGTVNPYNSYSEPVGNSSGNPISFNLEMKVYSY